MTSDIYLFCFKSHRGAQWQEFKINYWQKLSLLGSFVKGAVVPIQKHLFIASAFMEINDWCLGLGIYMLKPCLNCSNLKTSCKVSIFWKNWPLFKTVLTYWIVPYWYLFLSYQGKRISNWFRIVSFDILILKKQLFSS